MSGPGAFRLWDEPLLSRSAIDRSGRVRSDEAALRAGWGGAALLGVDAAGRAALAGERLALTPAADLAPEPWPGAVFLGVVDGRHVWAARVESVPEPAGDLRSLGSRLGDVDSDLLVHAVALLNWHDRHRYSTVDGSPSRPSLSGWSRYGSAGGGEEFPRTDPAMICLVHDGGDRLLLARQARWPERRYSVLAGFVEAGESLEACVVREIREEVGLDVSKVHYLGSQPWPFPRSLMVGFEALADPAQPLCFRDGEIAEAGWFTRAEVRAALAVGDWIHEAGAPMLLPGEISISRWMIANWAAGR